MFLLGAAGHPITTSVLGGIVLGPLIALPILFFIVQGMIWPLARHYQGGGTFLEQCYTTFLPLAPLFFVGSVAITLLATSPTSRIGAILFLVEFILFIYASVLLVVSLRAVHGLTTWEAITLALLPMFSILALLVIVLIVVMVMAASSNDSSSGNSNNSNSSNDKNNNGNNDQNNNVGYYQRRNRYDDGWWWWWGPGYRNNNVNQSPQFVDSNIDQNNPRLKRQWFCLACQYRRWLRQGPVEVACSRCDAPMRATDAVR